MKDIGLTIRKVRKQKLMTQDALAEATGLGRAYVSSIENGRRNLTLKTLCRIAKALGYRVGLVYEEEPCEQVVLRT